MSEMKDNSRKIIGVVAMVIAALAIGVSLKALLLLAIVIAFVALFAYIFGNAFISKAGSVDQKLQQFGTD